MNKPIPRKLLIHSATYGAITVDAYGEQTTTETELTRVRFEPVKQTMFSKLGESKNDKFMMFFDCKNSRPVGQTFTQLDEITFDGVKLSIREVTPCYDNSHLHHYEVSLT